MENECISHEFHLVFVLMSNVAGLGDMAVSNSIGSNIFDVLLGLGFPWALRTLIVSYGSVVTTVFSTQCFIQLKHCNILLMSSKHQCSCSGLGTSPFQDYNINCFIVASSVLVHKTHAFGLTGSCCLMRIH